jgi:tripartite-type tricarboxylate transporter receptor subunit TctC
MQNQRRDLSRRGFLKASAAAAAASGIGTVPAFAQSFPERNIDVVIPTREGGGADRLFRAFSSVWKNYLTTDLEPGFFPGASGRVGYEVYLGKNAPDAYSLIFGNMGPEIAVMVTSEADYSFPEDFQYFCRLDNDPSVLFVAADSPFQTIDDVIAAGKERVLNVGTSRLPHPASIGALLLAEHTGAQFNLVPLSGGRNTIAGIVTGEMDFGVLPSGGIAAAGDAVRTLLVWDDANPMPDKLSGAPTANQHFGTSFPPLVSARAFGIHTKAIDDFPERVEFLSSTAKQAFDDPAWSEAAKEAGQPLEILKYGDRDACSAYVKGMIELSQRYKSLLTGAS